MTLHAIVLIFRMQDWAFGDGGAPPKETISNWLSLCRKTFKGGEEKPTIGVHCVAGLGRYGIPFQLPFFGIYVLTLFFVVLPFLWPLR
jgi:protein tyrosine phosphatase